MMCRFLFRNIFLIFFSVICIIIFNSCSKVTEYQETKKHEERQRQELNDKETQRLLNEMSSRKEAILLAIKYKIEDDKLFTLLTEAETQSGVLVNIQAALEGKSIWTKSRLNSLSEKYNIPLETLASLLIDYYSMQACTQ